MDQSATSPSRQRSRGFSLRSDKSHGSGKKSDLVESQEDKQRRDLVWKNQTKANPNAAMVEAQPGEVNMLAKTTIESLRTFDHKDAFGNVITDPDLSNPTRPRLERPLDTIRSFENAIERGYSVRETKRRESFVEPNGNNANYGSRRSSSYVGGYDSPTNGNRYSQGGYYGNSRPESYAERPQRMRHGNRMHHDGGMRGNGVYPQHGYHQSYDTVMTGGSDSTGPWANSTDPSSENSSLDRINATTKPSGQYDGYASNGYSGQNGLQNPIMEEQQSPAGYGGPVQAPPPSNRPIPLGNSTFDAPPRSSLPAVARPEPEKKKSWLKRLSKKD